MDVSLVEILVTVLGAALAAVVGPLAKWGIKKIKNDTIRTITDRAHDAAAHGVLQVKQTFTDALKDRNSNGKIDAKEARFARDKALKKAKDFLSLDGLGQLVSAMDGDDAKAERFLRDAVESNLAKVKLTEGAKKKS